MTITARLSRTLHVAFGEDGAADMTAWMNAVDEHRLEFRELHEFAMARIDSRFGQFESKIDAVEARLDGRLIQVEARLDMRISQVEAKMDRLPAELITWTFLFWCGTMAIVLLGRR